jgi:hypothetical protein
MPESAAQRPLHKEVAGELAQSSDPDIELYDISHYGSGVSLSCLGGEMMAVLPIAKRAFLLDVHEVRIPRAFGNSSNPEGAKRQPGEHTKGSNDARARARQVVIRNAQGRLQFQADDSGLAGGWHDARQVAWVRKEAKHPFQRGLNPVLESDFSAQSGSQDDPSIARNILRFPQPSSKASRKWRLPWHFEPQ